MFNISKYRIGKLGYEYYFFMEHLVFFIMFHCVYIVSYYSYLRCAKCRINSSLFLSQKIIVLRKKFYVFVKKDYSFPEYIYKKIITSTIFAHLSGELRRLNKTNKNIIANKFNLYMKQQQHLKQRIALSKSARVPHTPSARSRL